MKLCLPKYFFWSLFIIAAWTILSFLVAYPNRHSSNKFGMVGSFFVMTMFFAIVAGILLITIQQIAGRYLKINLFYTLIGTLNLCCGLAGIVLSLFRPVGSVVMIMYSVALIISIPFLLKIFRKEKYTL